MLGNKLQRHHLPEQALPSPLLPPSPSSLPPPPPLHFFGVRQRLGLHWDCSYLGKALGAEGSVYLVLVAGGWANSPRLQACLSAWVVSRGPSPAYFAPP